MDASRLRLVADAPSLFGAAVAPHATVLDLALNAAADPAVVYPGCDIRVEERPPGDDKGALPKSSSAVVAPAAEGSATAAAAKAEGGNTAAKAKKVVACFCPYAQRCERPGCLVLVSCCCRCSSLLPCRRCLFGRVASVEGLACFSVPCF